MESVSRHPKSGPVQVAVVDIPAGPTRYSDLSAVPFSVYINPKLTVLDDSKRGTGRVTYRSGIAGICGATPANKIDFIDLDATKSR